MGRKEEPMIAYYNDPGHFADLMNGWIYRGEKKLTAEQIQEAEDLANQKVLDKVQGHCQAGEEYSGCSGSRNRDSVLCGLFYASPRDGL